MHDNHNFGSGCVYGQNQVIASCLSGIALSAFGSPGFLYSGSPNSEFSYSETLYSETLSYKFRRASFSLQVYAWQSPFMECSEERSGIVTIH